MRYSSFFFLAFVTLSANAQTPTFHEDIAPIIYTHCSECHRAGELGPMQFTTYEEVSSQGSFIEYVIQSGQMPPWTPDHNYTSFIGERYLTDEEMQLYSDWVAGGMPEGDPSDNPGLPDFPEGSQVGEPDLILEMPEPYIHGGDGTEQYQVFVLPSGLTEDKDIRAIEIRPDNSLIAHHALLGYTNNVNSINQAIALDDATEEPGYENFGSYGVLVEDDFFGGWAPGIETLIFPPTIGKKMEAGSYLLMQMHYGGSSTEEADQSSVNIFFADEPVEREIENALMSPTNLTEQFYIPANQVVEFHGTMYVPQDVSLISIIPHSHLLGKSWQAFATSPNNNDTIPMIHIPEWDFHWQGIYTFPNMVHIPAGYTVHAIASYDNTSSNPDNPNNPPQPMMFGDYTTDEMYIMFLQYVNYLPGDEDISYTGTEEVEFVYNDSKLLPAWPNPAPSNSQITIGFHIPENGVEVSLELFDINGRLIDTWVNGIQYTEGYHLVRPQLFNLETGFYVYRLTTSDGFSSSKTLQVTK
ncbi:MAG: hypothetical protein CMB32_04545 [Euryarchaeota archaeon]|nr:hypothetical protein [Euryarchaeota archaeon]